MAVAPRSCSKRLLPSWLHLNDLADTKLCCSLLIVYNQSMKEHKQIRRLVPNFIIAAIAVVALIMGVCFHISDDDMTAMSNIDSCTISAEFEGDLTPEEESMLRSGRICAIVATNQSLIYSTRSDVMELICYAVFAIGVMLLVSNNRNAPANVKARR